MKKGIKRSIWHGLQARRRFTMLWSSTAIKAFITVVEWTLLKSVSFLTFTTSTPVPEHLLCWTKYGSLLSATLMSYTNDSLSIRRKNGRPSHQSYCKLQIKNGQVLALSLGFTFFLSNFLWAGRSRHIVKTGSSGLHSQAVEAKNPWRAYRGELRQDWEDKGEESNAPLCSSNTAPGWASSPTSEVESEAVD